MTDLHGTGGRVGGAINALYIKELKSLRLVAAVLLVATTLIVAYVLGEGPSPAYGLIALPYLSPFVLAAALLHSCSAEWNEHTQHQWLALPVPRFQLLLAKAAAAATVGAGVYAINTVGLQHVVEHLRGLPMMGPQASSVVEHTGADVWRTSALVYGGVLLLLLGIGTLAAAVRAVLTRFRGAATVAVFLAALWLYGRWHVPVGSILGAEHAGGAAWMFLYSAGMAALFAAAGAWVFDRFADA